MGVSIKTWLVPMLRKWSQERLRAMNGGKVHRDERREERAQQIRLVTDELRASAAKLRQSGLDDSGLNTEIARQTRALEQITNAVIEFDGWPTTSVAAMANDGKITGGSGIHGQHFEEVHSADGLLIHRVLHDAIGDVREIVYVHWLAVGDWEVKCRGMGITKSRYFERLNNAYYYLAGRIEATDIPERKVSA